MRINKYLTVHGVCSRRQADELITRGLVAIDGQQAVLGTIVPDGALVTVRGEPVQAKPAPLYIKLNKPLGIECTTDRSVPDNIIDFIDHPQRIFPIGRLDKFSTGLILLTNDGDIVNRILRSQFGNEKEYVVKLDRPFEQSFLTALSRGVEIEGVPTLPCVARRMGAATFQIILKQGRNRQIRKMVEALGFRVVELKRVRIMHITLGELPLGGWRELSSKELELLLKQVQAQQALAQPTHPSDEGLDDGEG